MVSESVPEEEGESRAVEADAAAHTAPLCISLDEETAVRDT